MYCLKQKLLLLWNKYQFSTHIFCTSLSNNNAWPWSALELNWYRPVALWYILCCSSKCNTLISQLDRYISAKYLEIFKEISFDTKFNSHTIFTVVLKLSNLKAYEKIILNFALIIFFLQRLKKNTQLKMNLIIFW